MQQEVEASSLLGDGDPPGKGAGPEGLQHPGPAEPVLLAHPGEVLLVMPPRQEPGQDVLLQGGDGAGVEVQLPPPALQQRRRQHHEAHPHGGGDGLGEGVHVNHPPPGVDALQRGDGQAGKTELAVVVILDDDGVPVPGPLQQGLPPSDGRHQPGGIVVGR